jgi:hypothetical protein
MDREIKFRAWNVVSETMLDLHKLTPLALNMETDGLFIPFSDGLILMQYTGLKDKNGKEIYEGDVVRWWWAKSGRRPAKWGPCSLVRFGTLHEGNDEVRTGWVVEDCFVDDRCEVVGNIYENPELMEAK